MSQLKLLNDLHLRLASSTILNFPLKTADLASMNCPREKDLTPFSQEIHKLST